MSWYRPLFPFPTRTEREVLTHRLYHCRLLSPNDTQTASPGLKCNNWA